MVDSLKIHGLVNVQKSKWTVETDTEDSSGSGRQNKDVSAPASSDSVYVSSLENRIGRLLLLADSPVAQNFGKSFKLVDGEDQFKPVQVH